MKNFLLYKDEDIQVEIEGNVHQFLAECSSPYYLLSGNNHKVLLGHVANRIIDEKPEYAELIVASTNKVFMLEKDRKIYFEEPFDCFDVAAAQVIERGESSLIEISEDIQNAYGENFLFEIFPFEFLHVRGYFCYIDNDTIYVLFFNF